jgi:COMPASS component SWD1
VYAPLPCPRAELTARRQTDAIPESVGLSLDANALVCRFSPTGLYAGHFMAVGRSDGVVAIYDFETKNIIRTLEGHVKAIVAIG